MNRNKGQQEETFTRKELEDWRRRTDEKGVTRIYGYFKSF